MHGDSACGIRYMETYSAGMLCSCNLLTDICLPNGSYGKKKQYVSIVKIRYGRPFQVDCHRHTQNIAIWPSLNRWTLLLACSCTANVAAVGTYHAKKSLNSFELLLCQLPNNKNYSANGKMYRCRIRCMGVAPRVKGGLHPANLGWRGALIWQLWFLQVLLWNCCTLDEMYSSSNNSQAAAKSQSGSSAL